MDRVTRSQICQISLHLVAGAGFSENLKFTNQLLEKALHDKATFFAKMSHELRTPLNSILGFSNILLNSQLEDDNSINDQSKMDRWQMRWLHFIWSGIEAYQEFWNRTNFQLSIQHFPQGKSPQNTYIKSNAISFLRREVIT